MHFFPAMTDSFLPVYIVQLCEEDFLNNKLVIQTSSIISSLSKQSLMFVMFHLNAGWPSLQKEFFNITDANFWNTTHRKQNKWIKETCEVIDFRAFGSTWLSKNERFCSLYRIKPQQEFKLSCFTTEVVEKDYWNLTKIIKTACFPVFGSKVCSIMIIFRILCSECSFLGQ